MRSLNPNLLRIVSDDLRQAVIGRDLVSDTNLFVFVIFLGSFELVPIAAPNHDGEDLIRV
jgi:hypothetical protein